MFYRSWWNCFIFYDRNWWNSFMFLIGLKEYEIGAVSFIPKSKKWCSFIRTDSKHETVSSIPIVKNETVSSGPAEHFSNCFIQPPSIWNTSMFYGLNRCWWRMLVTKCVGDKIGDKNGDFSDQINMSPISQT